MANLLIILLTLTQCYAQEIPRGDSPEVWARLRAAYRGLYVPKDFKRDIPYASLLTDFAPLMPRINEATLKWTNLEIVSMPKNKPARRLVGVKQWVVDDSKEEAVSSNHFQIIADLKPTLDEATDYFASAGMTAKPYKPCVLSGPRLGDLCLMMEETARLSLIILRNNAVIVIGSTGSVLSPREPGAKIPPGLTFRRDPDVKRRVWELARTIDDLLLEASQQSR